jgi:chromosome segregation ATPase
MGARRSIAIGVAVVALALTMRTAIAADEESDPQAKLRDALRNAISQVRGLEDERAALQAKQAESDQAIAALKAQVDTLSKQVAGPDTVKKADFDRMQADDAAKLAAQAQAQAKLNETLEKWKAADKEAVDAAKAKETERALAAGERQLFLKRATICEAKNAQLFAIGTELLNRLKSIGVGDVVGKLEPFVGAKRVELQNLAQDYQDKLLDQKVTP